MKHILMIGGHDQTIHKLKKLGIRYILLQTPDLVADEQIKSSQKLLVFD